MNIHDAIHRLVLRKRWLNWSSRNYFVGCYSYPFGLHVMLSNRLTAFRPILPSCTLPKFPVDGSATPE